MIYVSLPQHLLYNGGREEFSAIMYWLTALGEHNVDWVYHTIHHDVGFKNIEDLTAFKLKFGL